MNATTISAESVRFPDACVECGANPETTFDLRVTANGALLAVPLCRRCSELKAARKVAWIVGCALVGVAIVISGAMISELVLSRDTARAARVPIVTALLVLGAAPLWLGLRRKATAFHRRFSAVWVAGTSSEHVRLGFRTPALAAEVAALGDGDAAAHPFRPRGSTAVHDGQRRARLSFVAILVVAAGLVVIGVVEFIQLGRHPNQRMPWIEWVIYKIGGRGLVLGLFLFGASVIGLVGIVGLRHVLRRQRRAP
jgi:hypothetical protein